MKKVTAIVLTLVLALSLAVTAFAAAPAPETGDVTGTYIAAEVPAVVYSVDIAWAGLEFTYTAPSNGVWNPESLTYDGVQTEGTWEGEGTITVTNRSNTAITATPSYTAAASYGDASMGFSVASLDVATAETGTVQTATITVTPSGSLPETASNTIIGTITITIS